MWRPIRWLALTAILLAGLPLCLIILVWVIANTQPGRELIERSVTEFSADKVRISGLSGTFPAALGVLRIELRDNAGPPWLVIEQLALDWSPSALLAGDVDIVLLKVKHIAIARLPVAPTTSAKSSSPSPRVPLRLALRSLQVERVDLAPQVAGITAAIAIEGSGQISSSLAEGKVELSIRRLDDEGTYTLQGRFDSMGLDARLSAREPAHGLASALAKLPELGALAIDASLAGPRAAIASQLTLSAGPLRAAAQGTLNVTNKTADLTVTASAPAMTPRPDLSWQAVALNARVQGPISRVTANGTLQIEVLSAAGAAIRQIVADIQGDAGHVRLRAKLEGVTLPGPRPDLLHASPLTLEAEARLDAADRPVTFTISHPLIVAKGKARTLGSQQGEIEFNFPDLTPFTAMAGMDLQGAAQLNLRAAIAEETTLLDLNGKVGIAGGKAPWPALVGEAAKIDASFVLRGRDLTVSALKVDGKRFVLSAHGGLVAKALDLDWTLAMTDLEAVTPTLTGRSMAKGKIFGSLEQFAVNADLTGEMAAKGLPLRPMAAKLRLQGLPRAPSGSLTAKGVLHDSPLDLALAMERRDDGALRVVIDRADWKSAHAEGAVTVAKDAALPLGKVNLRLTRLEDLQPLLGQPLTGSVVATLEATPGQTRLEVELRKAGVTGIASADYAALTATVADPFKHPVVAARLTADKVSVGAATGAAQLEIAGPLEALTLNLSAQAQNLAGSETKLTAAALVDAKAREARVSGMQANWKGEELRLLAPVRISFAAGVTMDKLRLGLREAVLEVAGRASPTLDLTVTLRNAPAGLVDLFAPGLATDGIVQADAKLTGTPDRPTGSIKIGAKGVRQGSGLGRNLPPANLVASAELMGSAAKIDSRLDAGPTTTITIKGLAPIAPAGPFDLRARGALDMKLLDFLLAPRGRRVRGQVTFDAGFAGVLSTPRITGTIRMANGEWQDYAQGIYLANITALLRADGNTVRIIRFEGRAGPGMIAASGSVNVLAPGIPIDLNVTGRKARLLASDRLTVNLDGKLTIRGQATGKLVATGTIHINRAEIRIPEHLPTSIAVLHVRQPDAPPPPPPASGPDIALDMTLEAPREIFVRGRGLDAELGGRVHLRGTAGNPQPDGRFEMRRGQFSLAGKTLTFDKGEVGFTGGSLTDPTLDFVANTTTGTTTATLTVTGTARKPKITLSSVPEMVPDEVLAHLLFGRGTSSFSPFEMAQIATAVASLTGITGSGDPLEGVRKRLGLDRLSVGGDQGGSPTLEAGRYVAPGIYVGTKQGSSGTRATVRIDIGKGLKLVGTTGTDSPSGTTTSGTNSVGITYQFEY